MSFTNYEFSEVFNQKGQIYGEYMDWITSNAASVTLTNSATSEAAAEQITGEIRNCDNGKYIHFVFTLDVGNAQNVRILCYGLVAEGDTSKHLIPYTSSQNYFECLTDTDGNYYAVFNPNRAFGTYLFYGFMGTDGGDNPAITSSKVKITA